MHLNFKKLPIFLLLSTILLAGCSKINENNLEKQQIIAKDISDNDSKIILSNDDSTQEPIIEEQKAFVITTEYVSVPEYLGLTATKPNSKPSNEDVNDYLNYVLSYVEDESISGFTCDTVTDDVIKQLTNGDYETVADYKKYITNVLTEQNEVYYLDNFKTELFTRIADDSVLNSYNEDSLTEYIDYANEYYTEYANYLGVDMDYFCQQIMGLASVAELEQFIKDEALNSLKNEYVIRAISDKEGIEVTEEEINNQIQEYMNMDSFTSEEEVLDFISKEDITLNLKYDKIRDLIFNNAVFE